VHIVDRIERHADSGKLKRFVPLPASSDQLRGSRAS
jgi:hypothetical protein